MSKKFMTLDDVLKKEHYRNILNLLELFEDHPYSVDDAYGKGLRPMHFRFALMKNSGLSEPLQKRIKEFFNDDPIYQYWDIPPNFKEFYKNGMLRKGSINSVKNLSTYLNTLVDKGYIKRDIKRKYNYYKLTEKYYTERKKKGIIDKIKMWKRSDMSDSWKADEFLSDEIDLFVPVADMVQLNAATTGTLCGISGDMWKNSTKEEKEMIIDSLKNIYNNLFRIMEFKYNKIYPNINTEKLIIEEFEKEIVKKDDTDNWIGFYFNHSIHCFATWRSLFDDQN